MTTRPKAVVFDIGNVLIRWQPESFYDRVITPAARRALFAATDLHAMNDRIDRGAAFRKTVYDEADAHPDFQTEIRLWHDRWLEIAAPAIPGAVSLNLALRASGMPTFILSNIGQEPFRLAVGEYPFLNDFDAAFVSGELGVIKPEAEIFARVEKSCGIAPEMLLFVDDRHENIAAAQARGWQGHLFQSTRGFADALVALGLLDRATAESALER